MSKGSKLLDGGILWVRTVSLDIDSPSFLHHNTTNPLSKEIGCSIFIPSLLPENVLPYGSLGPQALAYEGEDGQEGREA